MVQAVTFRIVWCRRQRARASSHVEQEAWRAEEAGLRDAVLHRDHVHKYLLHSPALLERYLLGFQDARALIRTSRNTRLSHALGQKHTPNQSHPIMSRHAVLDDDPPLQTNR